jgi:exodeoxyribonuclease V gamma subunit
VCEQGVTTTVVGRDAAVNLPPLELDAARPAWDALLQAWEAGMAAPLPVPSATAIAYLLDPGSVQDVYHGSDFRRGEREEACLARTYPDVDALLADGRLAQWAPRLFEPLLHWVASAQVAEHPQQAAKTQEPAHV